MTGYTYRGRTLDAGGVDLEQANAAIMAARDGTEIGPQHQFEWGRPVPKLQARVRAGRKGGEARRDNARKRDAP